MPVIIKGYSWLSHHGLSTLQVIVRPQTNSKEEEAARQMSWAINYLAHGIRTFLKLKDSPDFYLSFFSL